MSKDTTVLEAKSVYYAYGEEKNRLSILEDFNFIVNENDSIAIIGASGTGKSTLLHILGALDTPQSGEVILCGKTLSSANQSSPKTQGILRNKHLGFIYQFHHLLPEFTALENVMIPLLVSKTNKGEANARAQELLDKVGVGERASHKPSELSGGERQRVAIARAMVTKPDCILADEPTGNLDSETAQSIMQLLFELQKTEKTAIVIVTHDINVANQMKKTYRLENKNLKLYNPVKYSLSFKS